MLEDILEQISSFFMDTLEDNTRIGLERDINHIIANFSKLKIYEDSNLRNKVVLCSSLSSSMTTLLFSAFTVVRGMIMIIPVFVLVGRISWIVPSLMIIGLIFPIFIKTKTELASWDLKEKFSPVFNVIKILNRIFTQPEFAKDIRIYSMQQMLETKWNRLNQVYLKKVKIVRLKNTFLLFIPSIISFILLFVSFYITISRFQNSIIGIAELTIFIGALIQIKNGLYAIMYNYGDLFEKALSFQPFDDIQKEYQKLNQNDKKHFYVNKNQNSLIILKDINFAYNKFDETLLAIDYLEINKNETIVIVGYNGAGKSTLVKLICGFYDEYSGTISWKKENPQLATVMQDFSKFPLNIYENLLEKDDKKIQNVLEEVGLSKIIKDYNIPLTNEIECGISLSGGEWQRLAIARAILKSSIADLLIFDEPTSALDPQSELNLINLILKTSKKCSTIIISHRMSTCKFADRIIVMSNGKIIEEGKFEDLINLKGKFFTMFTSQASLFNIN